MALGYSDRLAVGTRIFPPMTRNWFRTFGMLGGNSETTADRPRAAPMTHPPGPRMPRNIRKIADTWIKQSWPESGVNWVSPRSSP
jgi:hypothetical protein